MTTRVAKPAVQSIKYAANTRDSPENGVTSVTNLVLLLYNAFERSTIKAWKITARTSKVLSFFARIHRNIFTPKSRDQLFRQRINDCLAALNCFTDKLLPIGTRHRFVSYRALPECALVALVDLSPSFFFHAHRLARAATYANPPTVLILPTTCSAAEQNFRRLCRTPRHSGGRDSATPSDLYRLDETTKFERRETSLSPDASSHNSPCNPRLHR